MVKEKMFFSSYDQGKKVLDYGIIGKKYRFSFKFLAWITVVGKISELRITVLGKKN